MHQSFVTTVPVSKGNRENVHFSKPCIVIKHILLCINISQMLRVWSQVLASVMYWKVFSTCDHLEKNLFRKSGPCRGQKFHSSACNYQGNLERTSNSSQSTRPVGGMYRTSALGRITWGIRIITYYSLMFFIAYAFKGHVHAFAGRVKVVSHSFCRTSAIFKYFCPLPWFLWNLAMIFMKPCHDFYETWLLLSYGVYKNFLKKWLTWKLGKRGQPFLRQPNTKEPSHLTNNTCNFQQRGIWTSQL